MKAVTVSALAASLFGAATLSSAVEDLLELKTEQVSNFKVTGLGGMTLRAEQVYNENFMGPGRGPRAYVRSLAKYSQQGATIDPALLCLVDSILQPLGLSGALGAAAAANCAGTPTGNTGGGTGTGTGTGSSKPTTTGSGQGSKPTATGRPTGGGGSTNGTKTNGTGKSSRGSMLLPFPIPKLDLT